MTTLIVGAHGKIGQRLCQLAVNAGQPIRALVRNEEQQKHLEALGVETVLGDLEGSLEHAFKGCDELVFTAGSGPDTGLDKTLMIDLNGAYRCAELAEAFGFKRVIMVSTRHTDPLDGPEALKPYLSAKKAADYRIAQSPVPHVIVRPGKLTDESGSNHFSQFTDGANNGEVSRDNVAQVVCELMRDPTLFELEFDLLDGEQDWSSFKSAL
ncbi:SDR family oxidoreductase [Larsenimonas salina]|uniref:SDR family oxidoreductase n=1 Tax=Larsenimonas salina TaxID=1295565 RepID=UPI002072C7F8|nr:SDR family oxidoreductase [Larsenimonas salina]MCM5703319.1 SDR family oxidoreductase [Larsenimonas salina]